MDNQLNQGKMRNDPKDYFEALVKRAAIGFWDGVEAIKLKSVTNQLGQRVDYVEHPNYGDVHPVIAMFPKEGVAFNTTFFDCGDFYTDSDYNSCYVDGKHLCAFEL